MKLILLSLFVSVFNLSLVASEASEEKVEALNGLFDVMGVEEQMLGGFEAMLPVVDQLAVQLELNGSEKEELKNIYRVWFEEDIDRSSIITQIQELYAENFSLEEIRTLHDFYISPIGQKFLEKSPELMRAGAQIGMIEAQKVQGKLLERLQPFIEKHSSQIEAP